MKVLPKSRKQLALTALVAACFVTLVATVTASAAIQTLGKIKYNSDTSCAPKPRDCAVIGKVTGFQEGDGSSGYTVKRDGRVISWSVVVGTPASRISYFDDIFGSGTKASLAVLRESSSKKRRNYYRLVGASDTVNLNSYFGTVLSIALDKTIKVKKGDVIGVTTESWAPIFKINLPSTYTWRASRPRSGCSKVKKAWQHTKKNTLRPYQCTYSAAQLVYSAQVKSD